MVVTIFHFEWQPCIPKGKRTEKHTLRSSLKTGFKVFFFVFVLRLPLLDLSGRRYTFTYLKIEKVYF